MAKKTAVPEALKLKTCKGKMRRIKGTGIEAKVVDEQCGRQYLTDRCPDKDRHLLPMVTGHCGNGWHEGAKAKLHNGEPAPTCKFYETCPCKCHSDLTRLFAMSDQERLVQEVSGYVPPHRTYWMPSDDDSGPDTGSSMVDPTPVPDGAQEAIVAPVPPPIRAAFTPTATGRTPKGQLEAWVKQSTDGWLIDKPGFPATPAWISRDIAHDHKVDPPSVGAISAVFDRWVKLGFAVIERDPVRFSHYTEEGVKLGLERMKREAKTKNRLREADDRRNLRR